LAEHVKRRALHIRYAQGASNDQMKPTGQDTRRFTYAPEDSKIPVSVRIQAFLLALVVVGCAEKGDRPSEVVEDYLHARDRTSCQYLTAPQARFCRLPRVPEPPARAVVIERVRLDGDRATIRVSYEWAGYRRHSTFALVRRDNNWLIARETAVR
jgi:hypothetical protein